MTQVPTRETQAAAAGSVLDVYVMQIPPNLVPAAVYPPERERQLRETVNERARLERYAVWLLLQRAVERSFGLQPQSLTFKQEQGKWSCDKLSFSLSHSHGVVAAAVSDRPCGVDLENLDRFAARPRSEAFVGQFLSRMCTPQERQTVTDLPSLLALWTKKESLFKCFGSDGFSPGRVDTQSHRSRTCRICLGDTYLLSVCGQRLDRLRLFTVEGEQGDRICCKTDLFEQ